MTPERVRSRFCNFIIAQNGTDVKRKKRAMRGKMRAWNRRDPTAFCNAARNIIEIVELCNPDGSSIQKKTVILREIYKMDLTKVFIHGKI